MEIARVLATIVVTAVLGFQGNEAAAGQEQLSLETVGRIARLLEGSGYRYSKISDESWKFAFEGGEQKNN
jgi:hypothetical protein